MRTSRRGCLPGCLDGGWPLGAPVALALLAVLGAPDPLAVASAAEAVLLETGSPELASNG